MGNAATATAAGPCPACGYDLTGLPPVHRCPECGFDYDPAAVVINLPAKRRAWFRFADGLLLFVLMLAAVLHDSKTDWVNHLPCVAVLAVIAILGVRSFLRKVAATYCILVNRFGVKFVHPDTTDDLIPWPRFGRAKYSWTVGRFRIYGTDGRKLKVLKAEDLGGGRWARFCARRLNALAREYLPDPPAKQ